MANPRLLLAAALALAPACVPALSDAAPGPVSCGYVDPAPAGGAHPDRSAALAARLSASARRSRSVCSQVRAAEAHLMAALAYRAYAYGAFGRASDREARLADSGAFRPMDEQLLLAVHEAHAVVVYLRGAGHPDDPAVRGRAERAYSLGSREAAVMRARLARASLARASR